MSINRRKKLVKRIGNVIAIAAMTFIVIRLYNYRQQITDAWNHKVTLIVIITTIICALLVVLSSALYLLLARSITGIHLSSYIVIPLYVKSNLYKYLPGNVMHYIGRNQIAEESEASHPQIALCTILEMGASCLGALLAGICFSFRFVMKWLNDHAIIPIAIGMIVMIGAVVLTSGILYYHKRNLQTRIREIANKKSVLLLECCVGYYFINQILQGVLFLKLLQAMGAEIPTEYYLPVAGVYAFAWLVGFVTPGAPGGLGVREAMLALFLTGIVDPGSITAAAVINRIITTMGDLLAFVMVYVYLKYYDKSNIRGM